MGDRCGFVSFNFAFYNKIAISALQMRKDAYLCADKLGLMNHYIQIPSGGIL